MTDVQSLIRKDAKRQLLMGSLFITGMLSFTITFLYTMEESLLIGAFYGILFGAIGIALVRSGWKDSIKAKQSLQFVHDCSVETFKRVPKRMYIGHRASSIFHAKLYDMDGEVYSEIRQQKLRGSRVIGTISSFYAGGWMAPATYQMVGADGETSYKIDKKGGTYWRGYVQHSNGNYVAYTDLKRSKKTGKSTFYYIEKDYYHWKAEGDSHIGHFEVTDGEGRLWAVAKRGAIPIEAADRFDQMPGYLIEWKVRDDVPHSLVAFLFLLQTSRDV
ncbi:hypothetical protein MUO14_05175 [Halobacillus shinanisalinarum]|uniref:DUF3137 domain-containing protein n=1 Tax=Halobacillus shinanisalinarum TaxID=2932258 RepID=A0ABY4H235_9BACI|nr:hypothetical protein [Halobacillus shinanisalinarum]UOQ94351.1 hypothetical protein MUO14_05175 [Halobacillus shinanisalinarum]